MEFNKELELLNQKLHKAKKDFFNLQVRELKIPSFIDNNDLEVTSSFYILKINHKDDIETIVNFVKLHSNDISCINETFSSINKSTLKQPQILVVSNDMSFFLSDTEIEKFVSMTRNLSNNINVFFEP